MRGLWDAVAIVWIRPVVAVKSGYNFAVVSVLLVART